LRNELGMPKIWDMDKIKAANTLIQRLDGTTKAAKFFEIEPPSVSGWRKFGIPQARLMHLRSTNPEWFDPEGNPLPIPDVKQS
jgi:hypothetical protein